jgi:hypothetical protein
VHGAIDAREHFSPAIATKRNVAPPSGLLNFL